MLDLQLNSRAYYLWNNSLGFALTEVEADTPAPVASLTKLMTALITLERRSLDEPVTITTEMLQGLEEFAVIGLRAGQVVTVEDLLYAVMLPSAGDAAQALAISASGSIAAFAELMNARATELELTHTHFSNPVGFDEDNYSTPADIARLLQAALRNPQFVTIFESYQHHLTSIDQSVEKTFDATPYLKGGKTGFTNAAGRCLASTADIEGTEYILVTLGADPGQNLADAAQAYQTIADTYESTRLVQAGDQLVRIAISGSSVKSLEFTAPTDAYAALPNGTTSADLTYVYDGLPEITPTLPLGTRLGNYTISQDSRILYEQELYYQEAPVFYHYAWVGLGAGISLALLGVTTWSFLRRRTPSRSSRRTSTHQGSRASHTHRTSAQFRRFLPWVALATFAVSLLVNFLIFHTWFAPAPATEVFRPALAYPTLSGEGEFISSAPSSDPNAAPNNNPDPNSGSNADPTPEPNPSPSASTSGNCTASYGNLMLINPNFTVNEAFIAARRGQLISVSQTYGIPEYHPAGNGDNLLLPEAAAHLSAMLAAYQSAYPGHEMGTYSCFRARGTQCGRLCAATGASDHHTGLTCDLIDLQYGSVLDTDDYLDHKEWQWLRENSYKYGFIDRFPAAWAGGLMSEPLNVDANGSTGLYETWHYRYVGITAATEIATGRYNNGHYDSLEHYLKVTGRVSDLKAGLCQ